MIYYPGVEVFGNHRVISETWNGESWYVFEIDVEGNGLDTGPLAVVRVRSTFFSSPPDLAGLNLAIEQFPYTGPSVQYLGGSKEVKWYKNDYKTKTFVHPDNLGRDGYTSLQVYVGGSGTVSVGDASYDTYLEMFLFDSRGLNIADTYAWKDYLGTKADLKVYISRILHKLDYTSSPPIAETLHYDLESANYPFEAGTDLTGAEWVWSTSGSSGPRYVLWLTGATPSLWNGYMHLHVTSKLVSQTHPENVWNTCILPMLTVTPMDPMLASVVPGNQALESGGSLSVHLEGDSNDGGFSGRVQIIGRNTTTGEDEVIGEKEFDSGDITDGEGDITVPVDDDITADDFEDFRTRVIRTLPEERDGKDGPNPPPTTIADPEGYVQESEKVAEVEDYPDAFVLVLKDAGMARGGSYPEGGEIAWLMSRNGDRNGFPEYRFGWEDDLMDGWEFHDYGHQAPSGYLYWDGDAVEGKWKVDLNVLNVYGPNGSRDFTLTTPAAPHPIPRGSFEYPERVEGDADSWIGTAPLRWSSSGWWIGSSTNYGIGRKPTIELYGVNQTN